MYISPKASRIGQREAQRARDNRAEIVNAITRTGHATRPDPLGHFHLQQVARVQERPEPLGAPRSPQFGGQKFSQRLNRLNLQHPVALTKSQHGTETDAMFTGAYVH
jgi:hypothetical protein